VEQAASTAVDRGAPRRVLLASAAHVALLVGFFLPWLVGPYGARDSLSGLDLVRVAETLADAYPEAHAVASALAFATAAVPGLAVAGLALIWITPRLGWQQRAAAGIAAWVAVAIGVAIVGLTVLVGRAGGHSELIDAPGLGLFLMAAALPVAAGALVAREGPR
jgi:hypothetical protein